MLSQVHGTLRCVDRLAKSDGLVIPSAHIEAMKVDEANYQVELKCFDYPDLGPEHFKVPLGSTPLLSETLALLSGPVAEVPEDIVSEASPAV